MNFPRPLITIAIPTYNRSAYLDQLLSSIEHQVEHSPKIQLIISDNASTDATSDVVGRFLDRGLIAEYIKNPQNIGAEANFVQCFDRAQGKYFWIIGDDDIVIPGGIEKILDLLAQKELDLVYLESFPIEENKKYAEIKSSLSFEEIKDPAEFAKKINVYFTFISGNIINRDKILDRMAVDPKILLGSSLVQLSWVYSALNNFSRGLRIQDRLIGARVDNTGGYKLFDVFGKNLKEITNTYIENDKVARYIINGTIQRFLPGLIMSYEKSHGKFVEEGEISEALRSVFSRNILYWLYLNPLFLLPKRISKLYFVLSHTINKIDRVLGYPIAGLRWEI